MMRTHGPARLGGKTAALAITAALTSACGDRTADAARERAEQVDRDARVKQVVSGICTAETDRAASPVVYRFGDPAEETEGMAVVYVNRSEWDALSIDAKTVFAGWAALCKRKKDKLSIRDGNSGETLKTWALDAGLM
jgi:hypothetical protein